jgi:hypothetical protein
MEVGAPRIHFPVSYLNHAECVSSLAKPVNQIFADGLVTLFDGVLIDTLSQESYGWGTRIRTWIGRSRVCCPAVGRSPSFVEF